MTFDALSWYTSANDQDTLYNAVKAALQKVSKGVTHYLQRCSVAELTRLSIREVLALYLVDVAALCQDK